MTGPDNQPMKPCPICGRAAHARYRPFCSARCADIDLGRWLKESYRVPAKPELEEDEIPSGSSEEADKRVH